MSLPAKVLHPVHPERVCWGCPLYCPAEDLACGNGTIRTPHPSELFGEDWLDFESSHLTTSVPAIPAGKCAANVQR